MSGERFHAALAERVNAGVGPDVRPVASEAAQFDVVPVRFFADPEDANESTAASVVGLSASAANSAVAFAISAEKELPYHG